MQEVVWYCVNDGEYDFGPAFDSQEDAEIYLARLGGARFRIRRYAKEIGYVF